MKWETEQSASKRDTTSVPTWMVKRKMNKGERRNREGNSGSLVMSDHAGNDAVLSQRKQTFSFPI